MKKSSILMISNSCNYSKSVMFKLLEHNISYEHTNKGLKALELIGEIQPLVIILEYKIADMDCFKFLELLRKKNDGEIPHIIGVLESKDIKNCKKMLVVGIEEYYFKDIDIPEHIFNNLNLFIKNYDVKNELNCTSHILEYTAQKLEDSERIQSEFVSNISHEIRTPLSVIIGFSELVSLNITENNLTKYLESINTAAKGLLELINDILRISQIESGGLKINNEEICLSDLFAEVGIYYKIVFEEGKIDYLYDIDKSVPDIIISDVAILKQILFNLVGNAIKYTAEGFVKLTGSIKSGNYEEGKIGLIIEVEDTGRGITGEDEEFIFQSVGKAGLGLSICRKLLIMTGGDLRFEGREGGGTKFIVEMQIELP